MEENVISDALNWLASQQPGTSEYKNALAAYTTLIAIEKSLHDMKEPSLISKIMNNAAFVNGLVTIIVAVGMLHFEKTDIITSSVRSFVRSR